MCSEPTDDAPIQSTAEEDAAHERIVLAAVLEVHPGQITEAELVREHADDPHSARDSFERAIADLARAGLLHRHGGFVLPTRAAVRVKELWGVLG